MYQALTLPRTSSQHLSLSLSLAEIAVVYLVVDTENRFSRFLLYDCFREYPFQRAIFLSRYRVRKELCVLTEIRFEHVFNT